MCRSADLHSRIQLKIKIAPLRAGSITSELGQLINLKELWLWGNALTGAFEFGFLTSCVAPDLHIQNSIEYLPPCIGSIPSDLGRLVKLEQLGLFDNALAGE